MRCSQRRAALWFAIYPSAPAWLSFGVRLLDRMKASTLANCCSWLLVIPLLAASIAHAIFCYRYWGRLMSGNSFTDPVWFILSYLAPAAGGGIAALTFLRRRGKVKSWSVTFATTISLIFTIALLIFGFWCIHGMRGFYMSDEVWWLKPFRLVGI